jgi:hypothetical protein
MALPVQITLGTGSKVSVNYNSKDAHVSVTYELERGDEDLMRFLEEKAPEVEAAHSRLWQTLKLADQRNSVEQDGANGNAQVNGNESPGRWHDHVDNNGATSSEATNGNTYRGNDNGGSGATRYGDGPTEKQCAAIAVISRKLGLSGHDISTLIGARFGKHDVPELSKKETSQLINELQRRERSAA